MASRAGIPAWKRLGLKLKYANENSEHLPNPNKSVANSPAIPASESPKQSIPSTSEPPRKKRRTDGRANGISEHPPPASNQATNGNKNPSEKILKKQVSFATDTKPAYLVTDKPSTRSNGSNAEEVQAVTPAKRSKKKSAKSHRNKTQHPAGEKSNTALEYLDQHYTARGSWKFNKTREIWILKHALSESDIPRDYDLALARYIHGLQGTGARGRLRHQCLEELKGRSPGSMNEETYPSTKAEQDEKHAQRFMNDLKESPMISDSANEDGTDYAEGYKSWLLKQSRSKILLWALGMQTEGRSGMDRVSGTDKLAKTVKKKKNRTMVVEYDSSSSDSSSSDSGSESGSADSDEETSSSGTSSDSEGDGDSSSTAVSDNESA